MFSFLKKKEEEKKSLRNVKELLRENLSSIPVDMFYVDDPIFSLSDEDRKLYLQHFQILAGDKMLMDRIKWLINKQARLLVNDVKNEDVTAQSAGAMTINGLALVKDQIEYLASLFQKENAEPVTIAPEDRFKI